MLFGLVCFWNIVGFMCGHSHSRDWKVGRFGSFVIIYNEYLIAKFLKFNFFMIFYKFTEDLIVRDVKKKFLPQAYKKVVVYYF